MKINVTPAQHFEKVRLRHFKALANITDHHSSGCQALKQFDIVSHFKIRAVRWWQEAPYRKLSCIFRTD